MAIDATKEELLSLLEASKSLPRIDGKRPARSTLWRWCRRGLNGVHLEYVRVGRDIATSREALARFFVALAQADQPLAARARQNASVLVKPGISERTHKRSIESAEARLTAAGI